MLGSDGVVIFDEAHKAKNALAGDEANLPSPAQTVIDLQDPERNSDYRVVYHQPRERPMFATWPT